MKKLLVMLVVFGMASVATASLSLSYDGSELGVELGPGHDMYALDAKIVISDGVGTIGTADTIAVFTGFSIPIVEAGGSTDTSRWYTGATLVLAGGGPIVGPATILGGMDLAYSSDEVTIQLVILEPGTNVDQQDVPAGVLDEIVIPEPLTMSLLGLGGLALLRRRRA